MTDTLASTDKTAAIRVLNDTLRKTGIGGRTVLTQGISQLPADDLAAILRGVASFDQFTERNDPYGEGDCALIDVDGHQVLWKIDYFNPDLDGHSLDPADPLVTCRVLTIMLAEEY